MGSEDLVKGKEGVAQGTRLRYDYRWHIRHRLTA